MMKDFTISLSNAYLHLSMDDKSEDMLTKRTHKGMFKVDRLQLFEVKVALLIWQGFMDKT